MTGGRLRVVSLKPVPNVVETRAGNMAWLILRLARKKYVPDFSSIKNQVLR